MELSFREIKENATQNQLIRIANKHLRMMNKILGTHYVPWMLEPEIEEEILSDRDIEKWFMKESATVENTLCCISQMINLQGVSSLNPMNRDTHYGLLRGEEVFSSVNRKHTNKLSTKYVIYQLINKTNQKIYIGVMDIELIDNIADSVVSNSILQKLKEDADMYLRDEGLIWDEIQKYGWEGFIINVLPQVYEEKSSADNYSKTLVHCCNSRWEGRAYNGQFELDPDWDPSIVEWTVEEMNRRRKKLGNVRSNSHKKEFKIKVKKTGEIMIFESSDEFMKHFGCSPNTLVKFRRGKSLKYNRLYEIVK